MLKVQQERLMFLCWKTFEEHPEGKELLDMYKDGLLLKVSHDGPPRSAEDAMWRDGQNSIIKGFLANIEAYKLMMKANANKTKG